MCTGMRVRRGKEGMNQEGWKDVREEGMKQQERKGDVKLRRL